MNTLLPSSTFHCSSFSSSLKFLRRHTSNHRHHQLCSCSALAADSGRDPQPVRGNHGGVQLEERVDMGSEKTRIDSWISSRIRGVSRARIQSTIRSGLVTVNGRIIDKVSHVIRGGDKVSCTVCELQPLRAVPEDIPLDIVYEDAHVLVVNKPSHMVVHPAPGNPNGTLVNAILHHCSLPAVACTINSRISLETDEDIMPSDDEFDGLYSDQSFLELKSQNSEALVRPGIVHRLDKGTSGLLVVAKDEHSHAHLAEQFKQHTIHRVYISITSGVPSPSSGRIEMPIARDPNNRIRMTSGPGLNSSRGARYAASRYKVLEVFAGGGSALVRWRLETGRTHQIRAHAKYLGIPLMGDELYGGTKSLALSLLKPRIPSSGYSHLCSMISKLERPCLHALSLRFQHPHTGEYLQFSCPPPHDFAELWSQFRSMSDASTTKSEMEIEM